MSDKIMNAFKDEFDRFLGLMELQIDRCPEDLWLKKCGDYPFSQQVLHTLACSLMFSARQGEAFEGLPYSRAEIMLTADPAREISKDELRGRIPRARSSAHDFLDSLTISDLMARHAVSSAAMGSERTNFQAVLGLIRHICYHLGCCDAALRYNGVKGVH